MSSASTHKRAPRMRPLKAAVSATAVLGAAAATFALPTAHHTATFQNASSSDYSIWPDSTAPQHPADPETSKVTLGVKFSSNVAGSITALRFYKSSQNTGPFTGKLWTADGQLLASTTFSSTSTSGWQTAQLSSPVSISPSTKYVASYTAPHGRYADDTNALSSTSPKVTQDLTAWQGVYTYGTGVPTQSWQNSNYYVDVRFQPGGTSAAAIAPSPAAPTTTSTPTASSTTTTASPSPTTSTTSSAPTTSSTATASSSPTTTAPSPTSTTSTSSASSGSFPGPSNTGVPAGTSLTSYTGPMTITSPTTINAKQINGTLVVKAPLTITNSKINGNVDSDYGSTVSITDSEIDGGTSQAPAVGYSGVTLLRVNIHGSRQSVNCGSNCSVTDSWLHGQYLQPGSDWHVNGYISNGGSNVVIRHNTIACDTPDDSNGGGCTGPAASFGDFAPIKNTTYDHNLFKAGPGGYCLYAGYDPNKAYGSNPSNVSVTNNVFEHGSSGQCGWYRPASAYLAGNGDVWSGNTWDDGTVVNAP